MNCSNCDGSGDDPFNDHECVYCKGTGREHVVCALCTMNFPDSTAMRRTRMGLVCPGCRDEIMHGDIVQEAE